MSSDFWWGMACIPAVVGLGALASVGVLALIWASATFKADEYKLLKRTEDYNRASLAASVACAKWTRYCWIPGWHFVLCRTTLATHDGDVLNRQHRLIRDAVQQAAHRGVVEHAADF